MMLHNSCGVVGLTFCMSVLPAGAQQAVQDLPGLSVRNGELTLAGRPYHGIGANYYSLFCRTLVNPSDISYEAGLRRLSEAGIPFVRFSCSGFWPIDWDLYGRDKDAYFKLLDRVVRSAETHRIGLIPSLFWHVATIPDLVGEPLDQFGNSDSKTLAFIRRYTEEIVLRYRSSPAIWGWEFGNEYNLLADLPNAATQRPPVVPQLKTPTTRTARDEMSSQHMLTAFGEFARTVRKHDAHRIIITGNSIPRNCAYHNSTERSWKDDTAEQFAQILLRDNPDPFDLLSIHVYPDKDNRYPAGRRDLTGLVQTVQELSIKAHKPVFIGEFGAPGNLGPEKERAAFEELLSAMEAAHVSLAAFWVFDLPEQDKEWNVTFTNPRAYMIDLVAKANARMQGKPAAGKGL